MAAAARPFARSSQGGASQAIIDTSSLLLVKPPEGVSQVEGLGFGVWAVWGFRMSGRTAGKAHVAGKLQQAVLPGFAVPPQGVFKAEGIQSGRLLHATP